MGESNSEYKKIIIPEEEITFLFQKQARKYAIMTYKIGGWLTPFWALLDYTMAHEHFSTFLLLRVFGTFFLLFTAYLLEKNKIMLFATGICRLRTFRHIAMRWSHLAT